MSTTTECPMYPPGPCITIEDTTTTTSSTVAITTTTVPLVDTGADSMAVLPFAAAALACGVVLTFLARRQA